MPQIQTNFQITKQHVLALIAAQLYASFSGNVDDYGYDAAVIDAHRLYERSVVLDDRGFTRVGVRVACSNCESTNHKPLCTGCSAPVP